MKLNRLLALYTRPPKFYLHNQRPYFGFVLSSIIRKYVRVVGGHYFMTNFCVVLSIIESCTTACAAELRAQVIVMLLVDL